ncbi:MAG: discoidin domain-containing protein [Myxococcales bacterium]|nr:discoidin domain-containing protein [Myxococcales bacterium]
MKRSSLPALLALSLLHCKSEPKTDKPAPAAPASTPPTVASSAAPPSASASAPVVAKAEPRKGPRWLRKLPVDSVSASTELAKGGFYPGKRAFDGSRATTWIASPKPKSTDPEWLEAKLKQPKKIWGVRFDTGLVDFGAKDGDLFGENSHAKKVSILLDGKPVATREIGAEQHGAFIELDGTEAKVVRIVFDEVHAGKGALAVTEAAILGDATDGPPQDLAELKKSVETITSRWEKWSASDAVQLINKVGAPILGDLLTDQRCRVSLDEVDLDGQPGNELLIRLTFEYKPEDPPADPPTPQKRMVFYAIALGAVEGGKYVHIGTDYLVQEGRPDGFDADATKVTVQPLHRANLSDVVFTWGFASGGSSNR